MKLTNTIGQLLSRYPADQKKWSVDVSGWESGVYFVSLCNRQKRPVATAKLVVQ